MPLVAHYPLQEDSGGTAYDIRGGNDGTLNGGVTQGADGILGSTAYDFDGGDDYLDTGYVPSLDAVEEDISISFWVKAPDVSGQESFIGAYDGSDSFIFVQHNENRNPRGSIEFNIRDDNNNATRVDSGGGLIDNNSWHHVVCIMRGQSASDMAIYVDGAETPTTVGIDQPRQTSVTPGVPFYASARNDGGSAQWYMKSTMSDIRIYDHALTPNEVQYLYNVVGGTSTLVTDWKTA